MPRTALYFLLNMDTLLINELLSTGPFNSVPPNDQLFVSKDILPYPKFDSAATCFA